jgi:hypothetical protein
MQYVVESLRQSLEVPYSHLQTETPELLFWILVLGSLASQGYRCHRWYINRLTEVTKRLGLSEWEEARAILGGFFYTDQTSEKMAEENLWNEVLLRESCKLSLEGWWSGVWATNNAFGRSVYCAKASLMA